MLWFHPVLFMDINVFQRKVHIMSTYPMLFLQAKEKKKKLMKSDMNMMKIVLIK